MAQDRSLYTAAPGGDAGASSLDELARENDRLRVEVARLRAQQFFVDPDLLLDEAPGPAAPVDGAEGRALNLRGIFAQAAVGIAFLQTDERWLYVNRSFSEMLGYTPDALAQRTYRDLTHPDDRAIEQDLLDRLKSGEIVSYRIEKRYFHREGHCVWVSQTKSIHWQPDGVPAYFGVVVMDITEQKRAEQALRDREAQLRALNESLERRVTERTTQLTEANDELSRAQQALATAHHRLRSIIDSTGDSICAIDTSYRLLVFNEMYAQGFERRFGYRPAVGMKLLDAFEAEPADREQVRGWWARALAGEAYDLLRENPAPGGGERYFDVRFSPIRGEQGRLAGAVSITRDVTRLKDAEADLRRYNTELTEANRRLAHANRALQQRNRELQDFTYVASHDLQEPLRKIRAFGDLVLEEHGAQLGPEGRFFLQRMHRAAARMSQLIHDLLAFSRIQPDAAAVVSVDLGDAARDVVAELATALDDAGGVVEVGTLPRIQAQPSQVRQLLYHLLSNAVKYRRREEPPHIRVDAREVDTAQGAAVELVVEDNGIGFDEKYLDRIFTPFERLHGRYTYEGTGIGLAICRRVAECHGGTITATSREGEGARFIVTLPVAPPRDAA